MPQSHAANVPETDDVEAVRYRELDVFWKSVCLILTCFVILVSINQIFTLSFFQTVTGSVLLENRYLYLIAGLLLSMLFLILPATPNAVRTHVPWYDVLLFAFGLALTSYFVWNAESILEDAWEYIAPNIAIYVSLAMWALIMEGGRRVGGWPVFVIVSLVSLYPIYIQYMPETLSGVSSNIWDTSAFHIFSEESYLGIPMRAFGLLVFGFLIFGVALLYTGAGAFFIDLAFALMGGVRGGPAKVAIFSSGLFGSMSGGPVTNVLTTGTLTIPAMRRIGVSAKTAGAIEACASTGGVLMPPIMGATAFIMANFLNVTYVEIAIAAIIPSFLYYLGLFLQIDAYAARNGLKGLPKNDLPKIRTTLKAGWHYLFVFALLVWMLIVLKQESRAPYYATALLLVINQFTRSHRMSWQKFKVFLYATGCLLAEVAALLGAIGLIVGALQATGMTGTLTNDLVFLAGGAPFLLLIMGAVTSFVLGIGMTVTAAYIFLAIILAPALTSLGLNPIAVHMFLLYWGMLSYITPPVALAAFAASTISRSGPMQTGVEAMRIGSIIYFIPFFFVLNPALIGQGSWGEIALVLVTAMLGIVLVAAALQGYLLGVGAMTNRALDWLARALFAVAGLMLIAPGGGWIPVSQLGLIGLSVVVALPAVLILRTGPQFRQAEVNTV